MERPGGLGFKTICYVVYELHNVDGRWGSPNGLRYFILGRRGGEVLSAEILRYVINVRPLLSMILITYLF